MHPHTPRSSRRCVAVLVPVIVAMLCAGLYGAARATAPAPAGPVYSLNALWARLQRDPDHWVGRTVRVRAVAEPCASLVPGSPAYCIDPRPALFDVSPQPQALLLLPDDAQTSGEWLRRLPVVGALLAPRRFPRWEIPADYTLQVRRVPCPFPGGPSCSYYAVQLL